MEDSILSVMQDYEITRCSILINELYLNNIITQSQKNECIRYLEQVFANLKK